MCDFKVGDEVVCVGEGEWICDTVPWWRFWQRKASGPRENVVYVIAAMDVCKKAVGLRLVGVRDPSPIGWWDAADFRKVQRRDLKTYRDQVEAEPIMSDAKAATHAYRHARKLATAITDDDARIARVAKGAAHGQA